MVHGSAFSNFVVRPYRHMVMFGHRRGVKGFMTGLCGAGLLLSFAARVRPDEDHWSRVRSSDFYKENFLERFDDSIHRLPAFEHGGHTLEAPKGKGHDDHH